MLVSQSCPILCDPMTVASQAPLSMEFSSQEYWSGLPCLPPGDLPNSGIKPGSPALQADYLLSEALGEPFCIHAKSLQSCLTLYDPMDCSPPGSSVHGVLKARILEWVATPSSRGPFWPRDQTRISCGSCTVGVFFTTAYSLPLSQWRKSYFLYFNYHTIYCVLHPNMSFNN